MSRQRPALKTFSRVLSGISIISSARRCSLRLLARPFLRESGDFRKGADRFAVPTIKPFSICPFFQLQFSFLYSHSYGEGSLRTTYSSSSELSRKRANLKSISSSSNVLIFHFLPYQIQALSTPHSFLHLTFLLFPERPSNRKNLELGHPYGPTGTFLHDMTSDTP